MSFQLILESMKSLFIKESLSISSQQLTEWPEKSVIFSNENAGQRSSPLPSLDARTVTLVPSIFPSHVIGAKIFVSTADSQNRMRVGRSDQQGAMVAEALALRLVIGD